MTTGKSRGADDRPGHAPRGEPGVTVERPDRVARRLDDLRRMGAIAAGIRSKGIDAYRADDIDGQTLRLAGRQLVLQVATVAEKLPDAFKAAHAGVSWDDIRGMRNLVAHHYDRVQDRFVWDALGVDIPALLDQLGVGN